MMIPLPKRALPVNPDVSFQFPREMCCNCGRAEGVAVYPQDTRLTHYFLMGGSEITFRLPLPFCPACLPSAGRRPPALLHRFLVLVLAFFGAFAVFMLSGMGLDSEWLLDHTALLSVAVAVPAVALWYFSRRPHDGQSSYYQPVRITRVRRDFLSGTVRSIRFVFTNEGYRQSFAVVNAPQIAAGVIEAQQA